MDEKRGGRGEGVAVRGTRPNYRHLRAMGGRGALPNAPKLAPRIPSEPRWPSIFEGGGDEARRLGRDARQQWRLVTRELDRHGLLSLVDLALLTDFCVCWARLQSCERVVSREGITVKGERGTQKHPAVTYANQLRQALKGYMTELGLTPYSRSRMDLPDPDDDGDGLDLLD